MIVLSIRTIGSRLATMAFGRQEPGLVGELSRARRAISERTKVATNSLRSAQKNFSARARKIDARVCSTLTARARRIGISVSEEYVRGAVHTLASVGGCAVVVALAMHGSYRIRTAAQLPKRMVGTGRGFTGWVSRAGDGDGVRVVHAPAIRIPGSARRAALSARASDTISLRLAGVDAPECAHFGQPGQAYGEDARRWLSGFVKGERVRVIVHSADQYQRAVASVYKPRRSFLLRWFRIGERNVSVELARAGYATVYEGSNAQFGGARKKIVKAVKTARRRRAGMWAAKGKLETPAEFKRRLRTGAALKPQSMSSDATLQQVPGETTKSEKGVNNAFNILRQAYQFMKSLR